MKNDIVRVLRVLEYTGTRDWVEKTLENGAVPANGVHYMNNINCIRSATIGHFPELMERGNGSEENTPKD